MKKHRFGYIAVVALCAMVALPLAADAQNDSSAPARSTVIPPSQVFSCGAGQTFTSFGITTHANVLSLQSPAGHEHLNAFLLENGYQICSNGVSRGYDIASEESAWGPTFTSQPNGPNTFPLEITRTTADGVLTITRRITGNSFVGPVPPGTPQFDTFNANGQGCDHMEECGNCTNRTIHVLTRITNNSFVTQSIQYVEYADVDISSFGQIPREFAARTNDSAEIFSTPNDVNPGNYGVLLQALILVPQTAIQPFVGSTGAFPIPSPTCDVPSIATPAPFGDYVAAVRHNVTLGPGGTSGNLVRIHYRRY